jgi:hypothetical protein
VYKPSVPIHDPKRSRPAETCDVSHFRIYSLGYTIYPDKGQIEECFMICFIVFYLVHFVGVIYGVCNLFHGSNGCLTLNKVKSKGCISNGVNQARYILL